MLHLHSLPASRRAAADAPLIFRPLEPDHRRAAARPGQVVAGVGLACALGAGLGSWMRLDVDRRAVAAPLRPAAAPLPAASPPAREQVRIVLASPAPPAQEGTPDAVTTEPAAPSGAPAHAAPSFDCAAARTLADQMVCVDPDLAAADRRMAAAYRDAAAGVAYRALARDQARWLAARDAAARTSPEALAGLYETRIAQLTGKENPARPGPSGVGPIVSAGPVQPTD